MMAACNDSPKPAETTMVLKSDSTFVVQPELPVVKEEPATTVRPVEKTVTAKKTTASKSTTTTSTSTSESSNTATTKKGWSKTAKGAVIGGVIGAGTGAIVNKKNRAAGAVIGGVLGAGVGAVIGNEMDKKDGRH